MKKIKLTQGKYAIVDDKDFNWLNQWRWHCNAQGYAVRKPYVRGSGRKHQKSTSIRMHILVNKTSSGFETDHINRNKLDNRKQNLRTVTSSQNKFNSKTRIDNKSGYKGISWENQTNKWKAQIQIDGKNINLGRYSDVNLALIARELGEKLYHTI